MFLLLIYVIFLAKEDQKITKTYPSYWSMFWIDNTRPVIMIFYAQVAQRLRFGKGHTSYTVPWSWKICQCFEYKVVMSVHFYCNNFLINTGPSLLACSSDWLVYHPFSSDFLVVSNTQTHTQHWSIASPSACQWCNWSVLCMGLGHWVFETIAMAPKCSSRKIVRGVHHG